jgi:hypothetical protein
MVRALEKNDKINYSEGIRMLYLQPHSLLWTFRKLGEPAKQTLVEEIAMTQAAITEAAYSNLLNNSAV